MARILQNPTRDDLVKAIHYNFRSFFYMQRKAPEWEWHEEPDVTYLFRDPKTAMYNRVEKTRFKPRTADARIREVKQFFASKNCPFSWAINPGDKPDDLESRLEKAGFIRDETRCMAIEIKDLKMPTCPSGFAYKRIKSVREVDAWARLMADGYGLPSDYTAAFVTMVHNMSSRRGVFLYTGFLDEKPVATAEVFLSEGVAGVYCIATVPDARGKGIGAYITAAPLFDAAKNGYEASILHATDMGYPVYERIGFREICKKIAYTWSPPPPTPS